MLSSGDLMEATGITREPLDNWTRAGILIPAVPGVGKGSQRRWSLMQAVGLKVALAVQASRQGCTLSYVGTVVRAFGEMAEADLLVMFRHGRTHFACVTGVGDQEYPLQVHLDKQRYPEWPNVQEAYRAVKEYVERMTQRPVRHSAGRKRGLEVRA